MLQSTLLSLALALGAEATTALIPALTGPHKVGTTVLELVDHSRQDPFAPSPQPRDLVISLFYPTEIQHGRNCTLAPQFPPGTAAALDVYINGTQGVAESITTRSCANTAMARPDLPLILLDHGLGTTRLIHSAMAEELASYGWNVVTVDHPYDTVILEYPDGRVVFDTDSPTVANASLDTLLDVRVQDLIFVLDSLADPALIIPSLDKQQKKQKLCTEKVGVFGHSFGGAAALQLLVDDARFRVGADLDGGLGFGTFANQTTDKPFVFFGRPDHNSHTDDSWAAASKGLSGFKREYTVNGTQHGDYTDLPVIRDLVGSDAVGVIAGGLGSIKGSRMLAIEMAFVGALFERFLKGRDGKLLDGKGLDKWPEVTRVQ